MRWLIVVGVAACAPADPPILRITPNPLALGATGAGQLDGLASVAVDPEGIVAIARTGESFTLTALAVGETNLTATRDDGETAPRTVTVAAIDEVIVTPTLRDVPCSVPSLFGAGSRASLPVELRGGGQRLHGDVLPPLEVTGATLDVDTSADGTVELRMPDAAGTVTLTANGASAGELRAFAPGEITAITLTADAASVTPLSTVTLAIDLVVDARSACGDALSRTITVDTPGTCELADGSLSRTQAGLAEVTVRGTHGGLCTVHVDLAGTALTATEMLTVTM